MKIKTLILGAAAILLACASCSKETPFMTLEEKEFAVGNKGETITLKMSSNVYYRINNDNEDWLTIEEVGKEGALTTYAVHVAANPVYEIRLGTIRFIGDHVTPLKVKIVQAACHNIGISPESAEVAAIATDLNVSVFAEESWSVVSDNPNFVATPAFGTGDTDVAVSFPKNEGSTPVVAKLTFTIDGQPFVCTITQKASNVVDLSAAGTANCYIVPGAGEYKFKATRGTGIVPSSLNGKFTAPLAIDSVGVLWSTYNTATAPASVDEFVKDVTFAGEYIKFIVTENTPANAAIAAYDADGKIIWSWHLWLVTLGEDIHLGANFWMDRNLGALYPATKGAIADPASHGFFYSFERKDPFRHASSYTADGGGAYPFIATATAEGAAWDHNTKDYANKYLVDTFIERPMTYIEDTKKMWVAEDGTTKLTDLWNDGEKTMFDPCPVGYRVPTKDQLTTLATDNGLATTMRKTDAGSDYRDNYDGTNHYFSFGDVILPLGGAYTFNNDGNVVTVGEAGRYCCSTYSSSTNAFWININTSAYNVNNAGAATQGGMMRCVKINQ